MIFWDSTNGLSRADLVPYHGLKVAGNGDVE